MNESRQVKWGGGFSNPLSNSDDTFQTELVNGILSPLRAHTYVYTHKYTHTRAQSHSDSTFE